MGSVGRSTHRLEGLVVDRLRADAVLVTPAHQFPTGAVMSGERRRALLEWANRTDALMIESDYDSEFRYDRQPVRSSRASTRTAWFISERPRRRSPALRLGWLVVPGPLVEEAGRVKHLLDVCSPPIDQLALARFIAGGEYDRHVRRARGSTGSGEIGC